jgi:hypothetical protein
VLAGFVFESCRARRVRHCHPVAEVEQPIAARVCKFLKSRQAQINEKEPAG